MTHARFAALLLGLLTFSAHADLVVGGLTYHLFTSRDIGSRFSNQISPDGALIATPTLGYSWSTLDGSSFATRTVFVALNSVGEAAAGGVFSTGEEVGDLQLGLAFGGYLQDDREFRRRGIAPFVIAESHNVGLVPVAGIVLNYRLSPRLQLNNLLTPVMTNHSLSISF